MDLMRCCFRRFSKFLGILKVLIIGGGRGRSCRDLGRGLIFFNIKC